MSIGGVNRPALGASGQQGSQNNDSSASNAKEFSLEQQRTGTQLQKASAGAAGGVLKSTTARIVDRKKRNRKGAPRTILVDGELYEVYLLAIA